jgi:hypothetical protein
MQAERAQRGITLLGFALVLCIAGFFAYAAMKLVPVYSEYFGVVKSMHSLQTEPNIDSMSIEEIRRKLNVLFDLQYVDEQHVPLNAVQLITQNGQRSLRIAYDRDIPFLYNVDLLVHFDKTIDLSRGATY